MHKSARNNRVGETSGRVFAYAALVVVVAIALWRLAVGSLSGGQPPVLAAYIAAWILIGIVGRRLFRLVREDQIRRTVAEQTARQSDLLSQLTAALAQSRTTATVIEAIVQEPLHALSADAGRVLLIGREPESWKVVRSVGYAAGRETTRGSWLAAKNPIADAIGRAAPVLIESRDGWTTEYGAVGEDGFNATAVVPLITGNRTGAVVQVSFCTPRTFTGDDREYLQALGVRGAQALDRTWQFESAQKARAEAEELRARADEQLQQREAIERALRASETRYRALAARTSRLHALTAALSEAVTLNAVAHAVIHHGRNVVGASGGDVMLLVDDGSAFLTLYGEAVGRPLAEGVRSPAESGLCATEALRSRQPVFVSSFSEWQEHYWRSASIAADGGYESSATLPLLIEGAPFGVLAFHFTVPVNFDDDYQALLCSVAQHCAQALDRSRLYESAQRARTDAESANRLKDEFVSIVSHELRTPLNAIIGWASILQRGGIEETKAARALQSIRDNAARQATLIDELLDFSRLSGGRSALNVETIDVRDLLRGVIESMIPAASAKGVEVQVSPPPPAAIEGDVRRLEQVFFNLIGNAVKFTPAGGHVRLEATLASGFVEIAVSDTGAGIEAEFLPFVFERFRQADSSTTRHFGGIGLGLSIAKQLVEAHGGTIAAESAGRDAGARFIVRLAIVERLTAPPAERRVNGAPPPATLPKLDGLRVLVVDDEPDARAITAQALETSGADVEVAGDASEAIAILGRSTIDVLLADIAMPGEDGLSLIRKVRSSPVSRVASVRAAAVTALARDEERREVLAAGFDLHVAKPFEPERIVRVVERLGRSMASG